MTYAIGDPNHIQVHNALVGDVQTEADRMGVDVTLPPPRSLGDPGHTDDHNLIVAALQTIADAPTPGIPWVSGATGGTVDTFVGDGTIGELGVTYRRHRFDASETFTNPAEGYAYVVLVGAGGTTGHNAVAAEQVGAGAGGGVLHKKVILPAGPLAVGVGIAGATGRAVPGGPTYIDTVAVPGGGPGSSNRNGPGGDGGSGGGGGDGTGVGGKGIPGIGNNGGNGGGNPDAGGGGGAGGPGVGPVGGPGVTLWGTVYGAGGSVVSTGLGTAPVANSGSGESISQGNNSRIVAANGRAFVYYPV